jgi:hypothetical protein
MWPHHGRRLLVAQVRDLATGFGLAIRTARALHLPVEPGVPPGSDAIILWAHPLDEWCRNAQRPVSASSGARALPWGNERPRSLPRPGAFVITQSLAMTQTMIRVGAQASLAKGGEDGGPEADYP